MFNLFSKRGGSRKNPKSKKNRKSRRRRFRGGEGGGGDPSKLMSNVQMNSRR
jgi:hypothetical protein